LPIAVNGWATQSFAVALGDLNGDGFLDAVVGNRNGGEIWFNDGQGNFTSKATSVWAGHNKHHFRDRPGWRWRPGFVPRWQYIRASG
jgi:hypothetical protein